MSHLLTEADYEVVEIAGDHHLVISPKGVEKLMTVQIRDEHDDCTTLWRYLRYKRFAEILEKKQIYFSNIESFTDKKEGSYTHRLSHRENPLFEDWGEIEIEKADSSFSDLRKKTAKRLFYASCWNLSTTESDSMWGRYTGNFKEAVAIETSFAELKKFRTSVIDAGGSVLYPILTLGDIQYINHEPGEIPEGDCTLWYKSQEYKDDRELRCLIQLHNIGWSQADNKHLPKGIFVNVDTSSFIKRVTLKPNASSHFERKVRNCLDRSGLSHIEVKYSALDEEGIF